MTAFNYGLAAQVAKWSKGSIVSDQMIEWRAALLDLAKVNGSTGVAAADTIDIAKLDAGEIPAGPMFAKILTVPSGSGVTASAWKHAAIVGSAEWQYDATEEMVSSQAAGYVKQMYGAALTQAAAGSADSGGSVRVTIVSVTGGTNLTAGKILYLFPVLKTLTVAKNLEIDADALA